jgi:hypothetical protein
LPNFKQHELAALQSAAAEHLWWTSIKLALAAEAFALASVAALVAAVIFALADAVPVVNKP